MQLKPHWLFNNCSSMIIVNPKAYLAVLCINTAWWRKINNEPILYFSGSKKIGHLPLSLLTQCTLGSNVSEIFQQQEKIVYTWIFFVFLNLIYRKNKIFPGMCHCEFLITSINLVIYMLYIVLKFSTSPLVLFIFW